MTTRASAGRCGAAGGASADVRWLIQGLPLGGVSLSDGAPVLPVRPGYSSFFTRTGATLCGEFPDVGEAVGEPLAQWDIGGEVLQRHPALVADAREGVEEPLQGRRAGPHGRPLPAPRGRRARCRPQLGV